MAKVEYHRGAVASIEKGFQKNEIEKSGTPPSAERDSSPGTQGPRTP